MKNFIVEVRNVRRCKGGHTCNLIANSRKVAFVGPDILEWSSHSKKVDILEWAANEFGIKKDRPHTIKLEAGWEKEVPDYRESNREEEAEKKLLEWINCHIQAHEIKERCENSVILINNDDELVEVRASRASAKCPHYLGIMRGLNKKIFNGCDTTEITYYLLKLNGFQI